MSLLPACAWSQVPGLEQVDGLLKRGQATGSLEEQAEKARFDSVAEGPAPVAAGSAQNPETGPGMSLANKAIFFEERTRQEHRPWFGLIVSRDLDESGNLMRYSSLGDAAIWTGTYIASQAMRYAVTREPAALQGMEESLWGFSALHEITEIPGLIARVLVPRDYAEANSLTNNPDWHAGHGKYEGWYWKGELSYDQYTGYLFGICKAWPFIHDPALRAALKEVLRAIGHHIMEHDMRIEGAGTFLDFRANYFYQDRGPGFIKSIPLPPLRAGNALDGLHYLRVCASLTEDPALQAYYENEMVLKREMDVQVLNAGPQYFPEWLKEHQRWAEKIARFEWGDDVQVRPEALRSDISANLSHMAFHDLLALETDPMLRDNYAGAFHKVHQVVEGEGNTFWNFLYAASLGASPREIEAGVDSLKRFPTARFTGAMTNSSDPSLPKDKAVQATLYKPGQAPYGWLAKTPLPFDKRVLHAAFPWQHNPYEMDAPADPTQGSGAGYLVAYWMGRYYGYVGPAD